MAQNVDEISTVESLQYAFSTIKAATNNFSDHNKLGQGGFGGVYKGKLPNGQEIAVKRLSMDSGQGDMEFKNEVLLLAKLQHRNLVRLLGFSLEGMEKLLVYEFVQNASLDNFIFDSVRHSELDWDRRYKIIGGIARGILYLHEDSRLRIIHRDLKASNILLDKEMSPKIADFGMARLFGQDETQGNTSQVVGTYGYMPPEYLIHGQFSVKSDVYSFGVLVLEIISGRRNNGFRSGGDSIGDLLSFAWKSWQEGRGEELVDPFLRSGSGSGSTNEMLRCIHIGLLCVQEDAADRPTMASVVLMLSSFSITLNLPSEPEFYADTGERPTMALVVIMLSSASVSLAVPSDPAFYSSGGLYSPTFILQFEGSVPSFCS
ncbi:cysteine-rich receptor-like protein kinase 29 [Salvia splendens]|uniref:cysteine-rich receptor-like protein kinase 29 n=1 Tax=Salvia splendens TaxID=180675 RepID=UPI001C2750FB|nr:cysteine-rich receptor-like protein kinase 29 [Salvia splendens]XP_042031192.1 cysteine-rich receptor-like protein kinase 29 [Salvia splendens]XP_042031193.1 cysteine-rich receptor-like protein kinase 29 [Salvia splendens]XP_042031194.1 cysteine-rich receptor-like protein kinase 29 [Salvia splendens]